MVTHRTFLLVLTSLVLTLGHTAGATHLDADDIVLNVPVSFTVPGGGRVVAPPGVYLLQRESDSLLRLVQVGGSTTLIIVATPIAHKVPTPEPIGLTSADSDTVFRIALLFPDGRGIEAVGTIVGMGS